MRSVLALLIPVLLVQDPAHEGETLFNGIRLPSPWPPRLDGVPRDPVTPPYLLNPPPVIPIDVGRQLFVDDFLVAETTLRRRFHRAVYHPRSPVLKPDRPWEDNVAMVFSDGVWYDPADGLFKMWYMAGRRRATCLAVSRDGLRWEKPAFDVQPGTNIVQTGARDSSTVWLDLEEKNPKRRFKMFRSGPGGSTVPNAWGLATFFSEDGIHWSAPPLRTGSCGDRSTVFWNSFRRVWVYSLRHGWGQPRRRRYWEMKDPESGPAWSAITEPFWWTGADTQDPMREDLKIPCELYNLDGVSYESLILGLFTIWRGQPKDREKPNDLVLGYSRDGWHWWRPDRGPFCPVSDRQGEWNANNVQSAGGGCLVVGDQLYFYVSGRAGRFGTPEGVCSTGLAVLRRDGFASMDAGADEGTLTTRPVRFGGRFLFVNLDAPEGRLEVDLLDGTGGVLAASRAVTGDGTRLAVEWKDASDLSSWAGRPVRFRFRLRKGSLYAFWISPDASGASRGYAAAGGPGFTGPTDAAGAPP